VDATFVDVPRQHNSREENAKIKAGEIPESFEKNPHVRAQKDTDARYTKKGKETHYGYKNHVLSDQEYKLIQDYDVTAASVHDSQPYLDLMPPKAEKDRKEAYADSAYASKDINKELTKRGFSPQICEKGYRNHPLTDEQKESNRIKSKVRCRIEHIFGAMKQRSRGNEILRTIGIARAKFQIGLRNLVYNMGRYVSLVKIRKIKI
jgi:IS5 family transposase